MMTSVFPEWMQQLPMQQQSVLVLGARGPDTIGKFHPCKDVVRAYRATVFKAAYFGRSLHYGEKADTFMSYDIFSDHVQWKQVVKNFFDVIDELPHHYLMHLAHGAEILGYKHPDSFVQIRWYQFYFDFCKNFHMNIETIEEMDHRLGDWGRKFWDEEQAA